MIRFQYDTNVFIPRISNTNKIEATYQPLLSAPNTYFPVINLNVYSDNIVGINISSFQSSIPSFGGPYATLTTTPTPALHIKMEIEDCNLPDSVIPRTDIGINASRYTLNAMSDVTTFHYSDELSGSGVKFNGCGLKYISSISPTVVRAGVGDIVTITGLGFGVQGDSGNVFLKNADNGGAGFLHLDSIDYLDWTDTQIIFTVPSYVDSAQYNAAGATAGSGLVKIRTDSGYVINDSMTY